MNTITAQSGDVTVAKPSGRLHIFVLIDALGWQIIKERTFLNAELTFRTPLKTVLGFSSGAIPAILTGLPPSQNGHWNLFYYDPQDSPFKWLRWFSILPERVLDNRAVRKAITELGRHVLGMGPIFGCSISPSLLPWFNWVEKQNIYGESGIPGSISIFDLLARRGVEYRAYSYHRMSDVEILGQARHDLQSSDARFYFLYLSEVDSFLHNHCDDQLAVTERLVWYEQQLREIYSLANRKDPEATFTVISDHGMTPVCSRYDLASKIERLGVEMPKQYLAVYDSTMARYWFFDNAARRVIMAELKRTPCGRILDDAELNRLGILFPDRRYGEVVFLLDPSWIIAESDFNGGGWNPAGMHGYHPSDPHSDAIFLSNRRPRRRLTSIVDIYPCMEEVASPK